MPAAPGAVPPGLAPPGPPARPARAARPAAAERRVPDLHDLVGVPAGTYVLGERGEEREVEVEALLIGRYPVVNAHVARFTAETGRAVDDPALAARLHAEQLADHPATGLTYDEAAAFCAWAGGRLPAGDEWEAAARGTDARPWPWGAAFDADRCASAETPYGFTEAVTAHPDGASPIGAEQMAGNVWEWVADPPDEDGWRRLRGGSYLDHAWGVRAARSLPADPARPTATTGFRIAADLDTDPRRRQR